MTEPKDWLIWLFKVLVLYINISLLVEDIQKTEVQSFVEGLSSHIEVCTIEIWKGITMHLLAILMLVLCVSMKVEVAMAIECNSFTPSLEPCATYVIGFETSPSSSCCSGVTNAYTQTQNTHDDRVAACNCIKDEVSSIPSQYISNVNNLPSKCGVSSLGYTINPSMDCNS